MPQAQKNSSENASHDGGHRTSSHLKTQENEVFSGQTHQRKRRPVDEYSEVMRAFRPSVNPLLSFAAKPLNTSFATQDPEEQLVLLLRKHPITQVPWIMSAIIATVLPLLIDFAVFVPFIPISYYSAIGIGWYLMILVFIFQAFISWYYNVFIITDERLIDVDFYSLLYRNITSAQLKNIEDVTSTATGTLQTMFDYGTVIVQTAGAKPEIEFEDVPRPNVIVQLLNELLVEEEVEEIEGRVN